LICAVTLTVLCGDHILYDIGQELAVIRRRPPVLLAAGVQFDDRHPKGASRQMAEREFELAVWL
jgi:hypothetical protein